MTRAPSATLDRTDWEAWCNIAAPPPLDADHEIWDIVAFLDQENEHLHEDAEYLASVSRSPVLVNGCLGRDGAECYDMIPGGRNTTLLLTIAFEIALLSTSYRLNLFNADLPEGTPWS